MTPPPGTPASATEGSRSGDRPTAVSRSAFLRVGGGVLGVGATLGLGAACTSGGPTDGEAGMEGSDGGDPAGGTPSERPDFGPVADACPRVERMQPVTGPGITTRFRMEATDLGAPAVTPDGRILFIFGDTFEEAVVGGGNWRSPVGLYADPDVPLEDGITWTSAVGGETAEQLVPYEHDDGTLSTILPGDVLTLDGTMYVWVMVNQGLGNVLSTEIWTSKDSGETWERTTEMFPGDHQGGFMQQCTWYPHPEDGYVYLLTTGFQRDKGAILSRVPAGSVLDAAAYETYGRTGETWDWGGTPEPVVQGTVGEMCLRIVEDTWLLTWFNAEGYRVDCLGAASPTAIADAEPLTLLHGGEWGKEEHDVVAQLYGPYIVPGSTLEVLHLVCSQWHTGPDWPYHVEQYRIEDPLRRQCSG